MAAAATTVVTIKQSDVCCLPGPIATRLGIVFSVALAGTVAYFYCTRLPTPSSLRFEPEPFNNLDTAKSVSPVAAATPTRRKRESSI